MKHWYLAYCHPREEGRAKIHLDNQGVESYYPMIKTEKVVRGKITTKVEPLFPRYLFVNFDIEIFSPVTLRSTRGIHHMVGHGARWDTVPDLLIENLRNREVNGMDEIIISQLPKPGQKVLITDDNSPYNGLEVIYHEPDGNQRSILLLKLLQQEVKMSCDNSGFKVI